MRRIVTLCALAAIALIPGRSTAAEGASKPKALNLAACPDWGAEKKGTSRAALNEVKHHVPSGTTPVMLDFAELPDLQRLADAGVKSGVTAKVSAKQRLARLHDLTSGTRKIGEGDLVGIVGFVVGKATANPGESANCYLPGVNNNDFEFSIAPAAKATPYEAIVGEIIPQNRPKDWTLGRLRKLSTDGRQVLVEGQLMFDTRHLPNPKKGTNHESPRFSTWEIHPVTKFLVCKAGTGCDAAVADQWQPLESISRTLTAERLQQDRQQRIHVAE
jgi:hypothetical protein